MNEIIFCNNFTAAFCLSQKNCQTSVKHSLQRIFQYIDFTCQYNNTESSTSYN